MGPTSNEYYTENHIPSGSHFLYKLPFPHPFYFTTNVSLNCVVLQTERKKEENKRKKKNMSYLNRVWMAATVAVAQGHTDPGHKCKTALNSIHHNRSRLFSGGALPDLRPLSGVVGPDVAGAAAGSSDAKNRVSQADDSLRKVMYFSCWGQG
ncbi:hypothetical protein JHK87_037659 [Glycine soja]|nr:hypothetical protein JHK87_037659 [Glycine soja]